QGHSGHDRRADTTNASDRPHLIHSQPIDAAPVKDRWIEAKAICKAERAVTENATNESMRLRIGQRTTKRVEQKEQSTARREEELASGHAEVRFAGYITISTPTAPGGVDELESTIARVELEATHAMLRLERMWGQQAEAFTYGALPLCRGLR
ncbi:MAG: hypothetical protein LC790_00140, partial [Actinobacteria bacterium]|nr:hypothetical protein [Actinomycetota bacterium]